jgi:hypothetical protein
VPVKAAPGLRFTAEVMEQGFVHPRLPKRSNIMWLFKQSPNVARTALIYITGGAMTVVWTAIWYVYLFNNPPPETSSVYYWCTGFLVTGMIAVLIGVGLSRTGHATSGVELPPAGVPYVVVTPPANGVAPALGASAPAPAVPAGGHIVTDGEQVQTGP